MPLAIVALALLIGSVQLPDYTTSADYTGTWEFRIDFPEGAWVGAIILEKEGDGYTGYAVTNENFMDWQEGHKSDLIDLVIEGNKMTFKTAPFGYAVIVDGEFDEEVYRAKVVLEGWEIPLVAKRKL